MDIEFLKNATRKINLKTLRKEINEKWVSDKIDSHIKRFPFLGLRKEDVKSMIMENDLAASFFIKDPGRQNISENYFSDVISKFENVENFVNHPSSVKLFLVEGRIVKERVNEVKSIDFTWKSYGKNVYATQKYTKASGGAQDNQFNDVINFLKNTKGNSSDLFFAIVDGDYYTKQKIKILKEYERENVKVCSGFDVEEVLLEFK